MLTSRSAEIGTWVPRTRDSDLRVGLLWLLASALLEECAFRGLVLHTALRGPGWVAVLAVPVVTVVFALSHVLLVGSVAAAALGHALFNAYAWRRQPRHEDSWAGRRS
jgi:membrane protease YdiL (CAAX protease family)